VNNTGNIVPTKLDLHAGDWVVVRSKDEILATLDANARLDALPFQPEMFAFCGRRMRVSKVAHKTCDTIQKTGGRRISNAVHLEGSRCSGAMHDGCQADCSIFWKEAWLRRADDSSAIPTTGSACTEEIVYQATRASVGQSDADTIWICQTTALFEATTPLKWWDVRQYVRDVTTGNHSAWHMFKLLVDAGYRNLVSLGVGYRFLVGAYNKFQKVRGGRPYPAVDAKIRAGQPTPTGTLDLRVGEWVEVKSAEEIGATITEQGFNRGMRFDPEMLKYSGNRYRVQMRIDRLINEQTGKMLTMKNPCIQLEDVYCRAECTPLRLGCPRASNTYWREIWLRRVDGLIATDREPSGTI
jgi:hypothetical protein